MAGTIIWRSILVSVRVRFEGQAGLQEYHLLGVGRAWFVRFGDGWFIRLRCSGFHRLIVIVLSRWRRLGDVRFLFLMLIVSVVAIGFLISSAIKIDVKIDRFKK